MTAARRRSKSGSGNGNGNGSNGWNEWSKHVLLELKRLSDGQTSQDEVLTKIQTQIAGLQVKSGIWGAIAGTIPVVVALIIYFIFK